MKKVLLFGAVALLATPVFAEVKMPTVYGKLNKEIKYLSQATKKEAANVGQVSDIGNSESRIGAKGNYEVDGLNTGYVLELGLNSSNNNDTTGRIRMRQAYMNFAGVWGTVLFGQTDPINALMGIGLDPLANTSAGLLGYDHGVAGVGNSIGYTDEARADLVGYKTPVFYGLQYSTSVDRSNDGTLPLTINVARPKTNWHNLIDFNHKINNLGINFQFGYNKTTGALIGPDHTMKFGTKVNFMDFTFTGYYQTEVTQAATSPQTPVTVKPTDKRMMFSLKYNFGVNAVAMTYGQHKYDTKVTKSASDKKSDSLVALGYFRKMGDSVTLKSTLYHAKIKEDLATNRNLNDNYGTGLSFGAEVTF